MARLLVVMCSQLRIELTLRQVACMESVCRGDRVVVSERAVSEEDFVHQFLTLQRQLQGHPQIVVIERRGIEPHREGVVQRACGLEDIEVRGASQQVHRFRINPADGVNVTVHQSILTGSNVDNGDQLQFIKMRCALFEVIGVSLAAQTHAGIELRHHITACADARIGVNLSVFGGKDQQVVVRHNEREVGIWRIEIKNDLIVALFPNARNSRQQTLGSGGRILAHVVGIGRQNVVGDEGLAVVEFNTTAKVERPGRAAV